eukprot:9493351-Pyramimonas_sp.AAC.1
MTNRCWRGDFRNYLGLLMICPCAGPWGRRRTTQDEKLVPGKRSRPLGVDVVKKNHDVGGLGPPRPPRRGMRGRGRRVAFQRRCIGDAARCGARLSPRQ